MDDLQKKEDFDLPGLNCGSCGFRSCADLLAAISEDSTKINNCIYRRKKSNILPHIKNDECPSHRWEDVLGREFDFILDPFEEDEGPRETIHLFNGHLIREKNLKKGDLIVGRPLAAGCPVTHCGKIISIDEKSNLIDWCVVGPLAVRGNSFIEIGSYGPVGFDGVVRETRVKLKIGERHFWMPRSCMIQWRHSGLITSLLKIEGGYKTRIEGVFLG